MSRSLTDFFRTFTSFSCTRLKTKPMEIKLQTGFETPEVKTTPHPKMKNLTYYNIFISSWWDFKHIVHFVQRVTPGALWYLGLFFRGNIALSIRNTKRWDTICLSIQAPVGERALIGEEFQAFDESLIWAGWPITEQLYGLFLLSAHDYEKGLSGDNGPCIPCLAPIHKKDMLVFSAASSLGTTEEQLLDLPFCVSQKAQMWHIVCI